MHDPTDPNPDWTVSYGALTSQVPSSILRKTAKGLYDYTGSAEDELSVHAGEIIGITAMHDGWISAVNQQGQEGLVPTPYLEMPNH